MPEPLAPKLKKVTVVYDALVLDPNNPRFTTRKEDRIGEEHYLDQDLTGMTSGKVCTHNDRYKIKELVNSIKENGWLPVDYIFVRKLEGDRKRYVVLEGNRRVAAIREIMRDSAADTALKKSLTSIEVMEITDSGSSEELQRKITYLLGVRHHGSLKRWTPFAQAQDIFDRYLEVSGQSPEHFEWNESYGKEVADMLSIPYKEVLDRLKVYRVMAQVGNWPAVKDSDGGMQDRYYSVCAEPLLSPRKRLGDYIHQDPNTLLLNDESVDRMNSVCHFDKPGRDGAPIVNPQEWRYLDNILSDEDSQMRSEMLQHVEKDDTPPSEVWAPRAKDLARLSWEKWLFEINSILKTVTLIELTDTAHAASTVKKLVGLIGRLEQRDIH